MNPSQPLILRLALLLAAALGVAWAVATPVVRTGDGLEYLYTLQALRDHGTPDLRPADVAAFSALARPRGFPTGEAYAGFFRARSGKAYCWHFFAYPLAALPAKALLGALGGDELRALQVTNVLALSALAWLLLAWRGWRAARRERLAFSALVLGSPILLYVPWTHPEVFTAALVAAALVLVDAGRPTLAAATAAVAAMQNPPLVALAGWIAVTHPRPRVIAAAALALAPAAVSMVLFGTPSLIVAEGAAGFGFVTLTRAWDVFADVQQGLVAWVPLTLVLSLGRVVRAPTRGAHAELGLGLAWLAAAVLATTTANWNAGSAGLMRYGTWMIPMVAWLAHRARPRWIVVAVSVQLSLVALGSPREACCRETALARWAYAHAPLVYSPDPEVFAERRTGREDPPEDALPLPFIRPDGTIPKLLTSRSRLAEATEWYDAEVGLGAALSREAAGRSGAFFLHPPPGTLRAVGLGARTPADLAGLIALSVLDTRRDGLEAVLAVVVRNRTRQRLHAEDATGRRHIRLVAWTEAMRSAEPLPPMLAPGASVLMHVRITAPPGAPVRLGVALDGLPGELPATAGATAP